MHDIKHMNAALGAALSSIDPSVQNGAVIAKGDTKISYGFNRFAKGVTVSDERWERPDKYLWVEHAERNAVYQALRIQASTLGATMYCPWAACADCARAIIESGIAKLVRLPMTQTEGWWRSIEVGDIMLQEAGVEIAELDMESVTIPEGLRLGQFR